MSVLLAVEKLLQYALSRKLIEDFDVVLMRNRIYSLMRIAPGEVDESVFISTDGRGEFERLSVILSALTDDYAARGFLPDDTSATRDLFETRIMGELTPRPSEVNRIFWDNFNPSPEKATDYFYSLCRASNYIQTERVAKDLYWKTTTEYGELEITVNLSKPEKDPRDIERARSFPSSSYPKCLLCLENVGFEGSAAWPARQNLRAIKFSLCGEPWYFQYSPYVYYNEHCIVLGEKHEPIVINEKTFARLAEFVRMFPHYFIGSNADLPIVGGSILSHDHFQGGRHAFPIENAEAFKTYKHENYPGVSVSLVKWPLSVIRLSAGSESESKLIEFATNVSERWRGYDDEEAEIYSKTRGTPHNAVTPIARYNRCGALEMDLVLRNNRTSEEHPLGIFHPHAERHHIKKENIGLIEVMGLAVLPGRLYGDLETAKRFLSGEISKIPERLSVHSDWLKRLASKYGNKNENADEILKNEVGFVFADVLRDCGVFKDDVRGRGRFAIFMESIGCSNT